MTERPLRAAERNSNAEILASPAMESPRAELLLFKNITFFLSAHVPERSWCTQLIDNHGGRVVRLEKLADVLLVDPKKKDLPLNSYSFRFIERCIRAGKLLDIEEFRAGPAAGSVRPVGSTTQAQRAHRNEFTAKDDQILYDWVKPIEKKGGPFRGNKIYQQLEERHPKHTFQSWRDRYLRVVKDRPRPVTKDDSHEDPASAPAPEQAETREGSPASRSKEGSAPRSSPECSNEFLDSEEKELLCAAPDIFMIDPSLEDEFWAEFAQLHGRHSATEWKRYFHTFIRPKYVERKRGKMKAARRDTPKKSLPVTPPNIEDQSPSINEHTKADEEPDANGTATKSVERTQKSDLSDQDQGRDDPSKRRRTIAGALDTASSDIPFTRGARRRLTDFNLAASTLRRISITEINETPPQSISSAAPRENIPRPASPGSSIVVATSASAMPESAQLSRAVSESDDLYETAPQGQATQDIFANPSQYVNELSDLLYPTLPNIIEEENEPTRTQEMSENEKEEIQELDRWIESRLETGRATDEEQIIQALSCTSMNPFLADKVLNNLNRGEGIPTNIPGVWTEEDDELHGSANHSDIVKLQEKHGSDNFDIRGRYLETVRQLKYEES